jgi:hypothetical protein
MDVFSRTMLACSAEAGLTTTALSRHVPILRRNISPGDQVSLLSRGVGSDGLGSGDHVLMLTGERLVVTRQSRLLGRVRLCLDAPVAGIENLRWSADPAGPGVELNFTVLEGPDAAEPHRWHFWLPASHAKRVWRIDALLARAFCRPTAVARPVNEPRPEHPEAPWSPLDSAGLDHAGRNRASGVFAVFPAPMTAAAFTAGPPAGAVPDGSRPHCALPSPLEEPTVALEHVAAEVPAQLPAHRPHPVAPSPRTALHGPARRAPAPPPAESSGRESTLAAV